NMRCSEVPVNYRVRIGESKVSGTLKGTIMAGYKILWTIFRYAF
ncbi:MAG: glycosyltransferase family 2 protein, partial [Bacteroidia bacterium]